MTTRPSVAVLAPCFESLSRFGGRSLEARYTVRTLSDHPASATNLEALINSPLAEPRLGRGLRTAEPLAGFYLESFLKRRGYDARVVSDWSDNDELTAALAADPLAILLSTTLVTSPAMLARMLEELDRQAAGLPIVVGGPQIFKQLKLLERGPDDARAAALAERGVDHAGDLLFTSPIDRRLTGAIYIASPFGEHTLLQVLGRIAAGEARPEQLADLPNLVLPTDRGWHATRREPEPVDLDADYPRWELIDELPTVVPLRTSIGCPHRCRFCDFHMLHRETTLRSVGSIVDEIAAVRRRGGVFVNFVDDNIFITSERIADLCRGIIESETDIVWGGLFRGDRIDEHNVERIRESGCRFGICGVESAAPEQLERMGRDCHLDRLETGVNLATSVGIDVALTFIVGYPGETAETLDATAELIDRFQARNRGACSFELYPFYLTPNAAVDTPGFRRRFDLRGRRDSWSHATMSSTEVAAEWIPYLFRKIERMPYNYANSDNPPWWDVDKRERVYRLRRDLTLSFIDAASDATLQQRFAELFDTIAEPGRRTPGWHELLAARAQQPTPEPGARR